MSRSINCSAFPLIFSCFPFSFSPAVLKFTRKLASKNIMPPTGSSLCMSDSHSLFASVCADLSVLFVVGCLDFILLSFPFLYVFALCLADLTVRVQHVAP